MTLPLVRALRATGADLPWGRPEAGHPGVALESWFWRLVDPTAGAVVLCAATRVREGYGASWLSVVLATRHPEGSRSVVERALDDVVSDATTLGLRAEARLTVSPTRLDVDLGRDGHLDVCLDEGWRWPRRSLGGLGSGSPPLALISATVEPAAWSLDARSARWRVRIRAAAPGRPVDLPVPVPGERRTALLSHQHLDGALALTVWRDGGQRFSGETGWAGLERGGRDLHRATAELALAASGCDGSPTAARD